MARSLDRELFAAEVVSPSWENDLWATSPTKPAAPGTLNSAATTEQSADPRPKEHICVLGVGFECGFCSVFLLSLGHGGAAT